MKKIFFTLIVLITISCEKDENGTSDLDTLTIEILSLTDNEITLKWTGIQIPSETVYRVVLNGNVVAENRRENYLTIGDLEENFHYTVTVFAIRQNQTQIFADLNFTTPIDLSYDGDLILRTQEEVDNVYFTSVTGELVIFGLEISDLSRLSVLEEIGGLVIRNTSLNSLNGLQNITALNHQLSFQESIYIEKNNNLLDISAISQLSTGAKLIYIRDNASLSQLTGLNMMNGGAVEILNTPIESFLGAFQNNTILSVLNLQDLPNLTTLNGLQNLSEIRNITLIRLNLTNLNGLNNLTKMRALGIRDLEQLTSIDALSGAVVDSGSINLTQLPNLNSLEGLNNVRKVQAISLQYLPLINDVDAFSNLEMNLEDNFFMQIKFCSSLTNLDGFSNLRPNDGPGSYTFDFVWNSSLSDFCGLREMVTVLLDGPQLLGWSTTSNAFNPTREMVRDGNCSQ